MGRLIELTEIGLSHTIAKQYGLVLDEAWNKEVLPHLGQHPSEYHDFVLAAMQRAADEAGAHAFLNLFNQYVKEPVRQNLGMLRKDFWRQ